MSIKSKIRGWLMSMAWSDDDLEQFGEQGEQLGNQAIDAMLSGFERSVEHRLLTHRDIYDGDTIDISEDAELDYDVWPIAMLKDELKSRGINSRNYTTERMIAMLREDDEAES